MGRGVLTKHTPAITELLRVAALAVVTFVAFGASWSVASAASTSLATTSALEPIRAEAAARGGLALAGRAAASPDLTVRSTPMGSMLSLNTGMPLTILDT